MTSVRPEHDFCEGDVVYVLKNPQNGRFAVEGSARIERLLDRCHYYEVRFLSEPHTTHERYVRAKGQWVAASLVKGASGRKE